MAKRKSKNATNAKIVGVIAGAVTAVLIYLYASGTLQSLFADSIETQLETLAANVNHQLPKQVDEVTRWDRVEAGPGKKFSYIYTVRINPTEVQKRAVKDAVTGKTLANPQLQLALSEGVIFWHKYFDASGKKVFEFPVSK